MYIYETVAAVPGVVGGMLLHLKSLRRTRPTSIVREATGLLVLAVQGVFFNSFFVLYILSPKVAHRVVGYLEEEAIHSYTEYLKDVDNGKIENVPAPAIAKDYWRLPKDATLRDVIIVIRADEAHHRDVNHFASDLHCQKKDLSKAPAPINYH
ncbi:hypothetical protein Leryth_017740 [Lithospermum erythrorhizon]|nr:hypothetical protein Leryth_017740 [Lithospermum erythrorhizon]